MVMKLVGMKVVGMVVMLDWMKELRKDGMLGMLLDLKLYR